MAPCMAAVVWNAPILLLFLFVCSVFSHSLTISFTRDELLDIRQHTPDNYFCFLIIQTLCRRGSGPSQTHAQTEKSEARLRAG